LIRQFVIDICKRIARAVLIRLAEDIELMQAMQSCFSSATFARRELAAVDTVPDRDALLLEALKRAPADGLICEFGVYKGYTLRIIAEALRSRPVYGFDSFEGLPEAWRLGFDKGTFKIDATKLPKFPENVKLYPGLFDATLPAMLAEDARKAAFLHVDCDLYSSTKCVFDALSDRLQAGTVIVFDEYFNFPGWENDEHRALIEASRDTGFAYEYIFYNPRGQQVAIVVTGIQDT
jgi:predicted O-methyltransferase YrrM